MLCRESEGDKSKVRALMPKCSPIATACASSPKDWAVLFGSHMQQEVVISFGGPTSRRTCPHMDCASTKMQNTNCNNFTSGNHVRGARFNAYFALSRATSARQCTTENPRSVNWRKLLRTCASCCYMLAKRVFHAPPGALAEHVKSSRMNWKVRFHSHGSSLMIDSNTQKQPSGTLF